MTFKIIKQTTKKDQTAPLFSPRLVLYYKHVETWTSADEPAACFVSSGLFDPLLSSHPPQALSRCQFSSAPNTHSMRGRHREQRLDFIDPTAVRRINSRSHSDVLREALSAQTIAGNQTWATFKKNSAPLSSSLWVLVERERGNKNTSVVKCSNCSGGFRADAHSDPPSQFYF